MVAIGGFWGLESGCQRVWATMRQGYAWIKNKPQMGHPAQLESVRPSWRLALPAGAIEHGGNHPGRWITAIRHNWTVGLD